MIRRRSLLGGLLAALAAPAIIRTPGLLMPVRSPGLLVGDPLLPFDGVRSWWKESADAYLRLNDEWGARRLGLDRLALQRCLAPADLAESVDRQTLLKRLHAEEARIAAEFAELRKSAG